MNLQRSRAPGHCERCRVNTHAHPPAVGCPWGSRLFVSFLQVFLLLYCVLCVCSASRECWRSLPKYTTTTYTRKGRTQRYQEQIHFCRKYIKLKRICSTRCSQRSQRLQLKQVPTQQRTRREPLKSTHYKMSRPRSEFRLSIIRPRDIRSNYKRHKTTTLLSKHNAARTPRTNSKMSQPAQANTINEPLPRQSI